MSRALLILSNPTVRQRAITWIKNVPDGTRVEFKEPKRTLPQNDRMWAILTEISSKALLGGQKYEPDEWKCIFLDALGQEMKFLPKLSGQGFLPLGHRSSELSVREMSELMELMEAWCAQNHIALSEPKEELKTYLIAMKSGNVCTGLYNRENKQWEGDAECYKKSLFAFYAEIPPLEAE